MQARGPSIEVAWLPWQAKNPHDTVMVVNYLHNVTVLHSMRNIGGLVNHVPIAMLAGLFVLTGCSGTSITLTNSLTVAPIT